MTSEIFLTWTRTIQEPPSLYNVIAISLVRSTRRRCDELLVSSSPSFACSGSPMPRLCQPNRICFRNTTTTDLVVFRRSFGGSGDGSFSLARHSNICFSRCCHLWRWACRSAQCHHVGTKVPRGKHGEPSVGRLL
jgi:hypothetical protein